MDPSCRDMTASESLDVESSSSTTEQDIDIHGDNPETGPIDQTGDQAPTTFHPFLRLPLELREIIYTFATETEPYDILTNEPFARQHLAPLPAVCLASRSILNEATPIYLQGGKISFRYPEGDSFPSLLNFVKLLDSIPDGRGFQSIRRLQMANAEALSECKDPAGVDLCRNFLSRCTGLRHFSLWSFSDFFESEKDDFDLWPVEDILRGLPLEPLFRCPLLREVHLDIMVDEKGREFDPYCDDLVAWMKAKVEESGLNCKITIEYDDYNAEFWRIGRGEDGAN